MVDYDRLSGDRDWAYKVNEAKKEWKREQPKVYRGKKWNKTLNKAVDQETEFDIQYQGETDLEENELSV